jgi:hypothetical protein
MEKTSEFGKGFVYNLILFAKHFENSMAAKNETLGRETYDLWFNGASDHLYELEIPKQWEDHEIGKKAKELQDLALDIGHGSRMMQIIDKSEFTKVVELTKEIALLIDKELGVEPIKGQFE